MKIEHEFTVESPPDKVWEFFQDVPSVADCLPGAELTEDKGGNVYAGSVSVKLGPMTAAFEGEATISPDPVARRDLIEAGRLLCRQAAWLKNRGLRNTRETSQAKWFCTDHAVQSALDAIQIHGAYGYSDEYPVARYLRNSKAAVIYEGTSQLHTLIQADYLLGYREDAPLRCPPLPAPGFSRG